MTRFEGTRVRGESSPSFEGRVSPRNKCNFSNKPRESDKWSRCDATRVSKFYRNDFMFTVSEYQKEIVIRIDKNKKFQRNIIDSFCEETWESLPVTIYFIIFLDELWRFIRHFINPVSILSKTATMTAVYLFGFKGTRVFLGVGLTLHSWQKTLNCIFFSSFFIFTMRAVFRIIWKIIQINCTAFDID